MTNETPRTLIAIATYNEFENIPRLVAEVLQQVSWADLLVIDDNSPDGTGRWCDEESRRNPRFRVIHRAGKQGLGTAIVLAICRAVEEHYDYLVTLDADFSHAPRQIPELISGMARADRPPVDLMIGSRYVTGGAVEGWPWKRMLMSRFVNTYARLWLGLTPHDCSSGFRCYRVSRLERLDLGSMRSQGYSFLEELLWMLQRDGARVEESPIVFVNRRHGQSKIDLREAWHALSILFRLKWS